VSRSSCPLRPAELLLSSTAFARPDAGTHGRRRLECELRERSDMEAGRAPATFSCLRSARHGEAWEASPRLERELGECSAMAASRAPPPSPGGAASSATWGRTAVGAQPWRPAVLPPSPASARPVSRTRGCLLLVGPSAAQPAASSSSAGMDAWIHAQSRSMTLSEHRKLEEVRVVHVRPKAMCVHPQRSRLDTSSEHSGAG
jgi:hypothetical protein